MTNQRAIIINTAITLIIHFCTEYSHAEAKRLELHSYDAVHVLMGLNGRLLLPYDEEALPVILEIFTRRTGKIAFPHEDSSASRKIQQQGKL